MGMSSKDRIGSPYHCCETRGPWPGIRLVGKRRRLLNYLQRTDLDRYRALIKELGLRR